MKTLRHPPARVGISACLLGQRVRYDGGDKRHPVAAAAPPGVEWVPVCPEVELGLGVPRPPIQLVAEAGGVRLRDTASGRDLTAAMGRLAAARVDQLAALGLDGYVLKARSPSCGLAGVEVVGAAGAGEPRGRGVLAAVLLERLPDLPVAEEGQLGDPTSREAFFARVLAHHRLRVG